MVHSPTDKFQPSHAYERAPARLTGRPIAADVPIANFGSIPAALKYGVNIVPPPMPASAATLPKNKLKKLNDKVIFATVCSATSFETSVSINAAAKNWKQPTKMS